MTHPGANAAVLLDDLIRTPVEDRAARLRESADVPAALASLIEAATAISAQDGARADQATDAVVNLADRLGSQLDRARARRIRARALSYGGRFQEALVVAREGVRLAGEAGSSIEAGRATLASMHALGELGRLDEAILAGEAARQAFLAAGEPALAARADMNLGIVHQRRDEPDEALACFGRAAVAAGNEPPLQGMIENSRGEALLGLNDFQGAERAYKAAVRAFESVGALQNAAIAQGNLAELAAHQGRMQEAMAGFERARAWFEANAATGHLARLRAERADAVAALGLPADAMREYASALPALEKCGLPLEAARARAGMGQTLIRMERWTEAQTCLAAAALAFDELGHASAKARTDLVRAEAAIACGRADEARALAMRSLAILSNRPVGEAAARLLLARLALQEGEFAEADREAQAAMAACSELDIPAICAEGHFIQGSIHRERREWPQAVASFRHVVEQVERVRGSLQAGRFRMAFLGNWIKAYELLAAALLDQGHPDPIGALEAIEQAKSRHLQEQLQAAVNDVGSPISDATPADSGGSDEATRRLSEMAGRLGGELRAIYARIDGSDEASNSAKLHAWRAAAHDRESQLEDAESRLRTLSGVGQLYASSARAADIQARLPAGTRLIEYFQVENDLLALVIDRESVTVRRGLGILGDTTRLMALLQFQVNRALRPGAMAGGRAERLRADAIRILGELHDLLWKPLGIDPQVTERLIIVPHGPLHVMPFAALWDGRSHLIERHAVSVLPCASLIAMLPDRRIAGQALVIGVADEQAPAIESEAHLVARTLGVPSHEVLLGTQATCERFRRTASEAGLIHLACHARFSSESVMSSGIRLSDRWFTVRDLMELKLKADLVTLSACETGVNLVKAGDELHGLLRGFLAAGAARVLMTLWRVDDASTADFMRDFYDLRHTLAIGAEGGARTGSVLREAMLRAMRRKPHPAFWAPFVLAGRD